MSSVREGCPEAVVRVGETAGFLPPSHDLNLLVEGEPILLPVLDPSEEQWTVGQPERADRIRRLTRR